MLSRPDKAALPGPDAGPDPDADAGPGSGRACDDATAASLPPPSPGCPRLLYVVTEDWYFWSHRLGMARGARDAGFEVWVATRVGRHGARIEAEGFRLVALPWQRGGHNPVREIREVLRLRCLYRRLRPDILHHVAMKPVLYGAWPAAAAGVAHTVNALTGLGYIFTSSGPKQRLLRRVVGPMLRYALGRSGAHLIMQNPDDLETLRQLRLLRPAAPVSLIRGSGVDTRCFHPTPEPAPGTDGNVTCALVARLLWDKGIGEAVAAARLLRQRGIALRLRLVGPLDPHNPAAIPAETLEAWCREGVIEWDGPADDIPALWRKTSIALLPSYREGMPKALLEAAAAGRPLVATDVPGCRDICRDGESGLLVPARAPEPLAEALARLAQDGALRARLGAGARRLVEAQFSESIVVAQTVALYRQLAGHPEG